MWFSLFLLPARENPGENNQPAAAAWCTCAPKNGQETAKDALPHPSCRGALGKTFSKVQSQKPVQGPQPSGKISLGLTCVLALLPPKQKWVVVGGKMHNAKKKSSRRRGGTHILNTLGPASHAGSFELTIKQTRPQKTTPKNWCIPTTCSAPNKQASTHVFFLP